MVALNLCLDNIYDTKKLVKFHPVSFWRKTLLRVLLPISGIQMFIRSITTPQDKNVLHDGRRCNLTGVKVSSASAPLNFLEIKSRSRQLGCTINDLLTAALTLAVSRYFKEKNDQSKAFNICIPANIRWQMYQTAEEVRLENKFSPIPMRLQVETDPRKCLQ